MHFADLVLIESCFPYNHSSALVASDSQRSPRPRSPVSPLPVPDGEKIDRTVDGSLKIPGATPVIDQISTGKVGISMHETLDRIDRQRRDATMRAQVRGLETALSDAEHKCGFLDDMAKTLKEEIRRLVFLAYFLGVTPCTFLWRLLALACV